MSEPVKLTSFSHGGGCGCKISPAVLERILAELPKDALPYPGLLVGLENGDDAAVYDIGGGQAIVATTDFFMPIVDDGYDFGRIAATNAISDVYAMGARPILALAILAMPIEKLPDQIIRDIVRGGLTVCQAAGIPLAGGHSIDSVEPIYGLVALGLGKTEHIKRNDKAQAGDVLVLGKPIGVGILSAALKKGKLSPEGYRTMVDVTTRLNTPGPDLAALDGVRAMTDVTGFGLLGHAFEMARGGKLTVRLKASRIPVIPEAGQLAQAGIVTGASGRNLTSYGTKVSGLDLLPQWQSNLLTDPQTSGGLLVSCSLNAVNEVLAIFREHGFADAAIVGDLTAGPAMVAVAG
ncbi:selenide, water dikinase SelD [Magnetospirillum moscoviense]|uniref:Selenide, water dikinase n=1 Tax=Magnetospirillum moscoviense TaxID=1437059 RepID=A0A178MR62_9PROT|nr:selenide, water dikinase SelD [Magnetospirillum moscoviense]MBF0326321.1 selenide, water dikinase SelD [Alphaproteobacteria bacterium]OAN50537.1 selenide,water dikinase SelD [Magnetospirillum moscoviense]